MTLAMVAPALFGLLVGMVAIEKARAMRSEAVAWSKLAEERIEVAMRMRREAEEIRREAWETLGRAKRMRGQA